MTLKAVEVNFDGLVGPTYNYGGLSYGNLASEQHRWTVSNPREAFLQGLHKMKLLTDMGLKQAVLPPHERPDIEMLKRLGYTGTDSQIVAKAFHEDPVLLASCFSASAMWAANIATVSPSADTADGRIHFTPANLVTQFHRSLEPPMTGYLLKTIFQDETTFMHHAPLPAGAHFCDEGAANHIRLCGPMHDPGIEVFVYGRKAFDPMELRPIVYPARQTYEASAAIARLHQLPPSKTLFVQQNPDLIDAGVFHNDVISVGNQNVLFYHVLAFSGSQRDVERIQHIFESSCQQELICLEVTADQVSVKEAVRSYLFNSQLVTLPDETMCLIAPLECRENVKTECLLRELLERKNPIRSIQYVDVRQSMKNGGGPACLRLRVVLTGSELSRTHQGMFLTKSLYEELLAWGERYYRDRLHPEDLADPLLLEECRTALDTLTGILKLESVYSFQRTGEKVLST